jgi:hypothetical protein
LESWLQELGIKSKKTDWAIDMLNKIYEINIKPAESDVWEFIFKIKKWIADTNRKGM